PEPVPGVAVHGVEISVVERGEGPAVTRRRTPRDVALVIVRSIGVDARSVEVLFRHSLAQDGHERANAQAGDAARGRYESPTPRLVNESPDRPISGHIRAARGVPR